MLTPRVQRMKNKYFDTIPQITAERLVLQTEAYKQFAGDAVPIFRAKVVNYILERMTTLIMDDELIVGTATNAYRGANLHPEFQSSSWYVSDIDDFSTRSKDPYYISPKDRYSAFSMPLKSANSDPLSTVMLLKSLKKSLP